MAILLFQLTPLVKTCLALFTTFSQRKLDKLNSSIFFVFVLVCFTLLVIFSTLLLDCTMW